MGHIELTKAYTRTCKTDHTEKPLLLTFRYYISMKNVPTIKCRKRGKKFNCKKTTLAISELKLLVRFMLYVTFKSYLSQYQIKLSLYDRRTCKIMLILSWI